MNDMTFDKSHTDYPLIQSAIAYISETRSDELDLDAFAAALRMSTRQLNDLFKRWCGLTPNRFAQAVALNHAKKLLRQNASTLETSFEVGLSSGSRLHDLFVTHEAMPPGVWRNRGEGLVMRWAAIDGPFGKSVIVATDYGIAGIGFADDGDEQSAFEDLAARWPNAQYVRDETYIVPLARQVFEPEQWRAEEPIRVVLIGTNFEVSVWETLLKIPMGRATTYGTIANHLGKPTASRAVGTAVGKNPISFVVPCHRVVGSTGALTGYHWGVARKRAILGWETGRPEI